MNEHHRIIGGSGLYHLEGFSNLAEHKSHAFGAPSDPIVGGTMFGRSVYFLPRHGRGHRIFAARIESSGDIYALRSLNVRWIICVTAVAVCRKNTRRATSSYRRSFLTGQVCVPGHTFFGEALPPMFPCRPDLA